MGSTCRRKKNQMTKGKKKKTAAAAATAKTKRRRQMQTISSSLRRRRQKNVFGNKKGGMNPLKPIVAAAAFLTGTKGASSAPSSASLSLSNPVAAFNSSSPLTMSSTKNIYTPVNTFASYWDQDEFEKTLTKEVVDSDEHVAIRRNAQKRDYIRPSNNVSNKQTIFINAIDGRFQDQETFEKKLTKEVVDSDEYVEIRRKAQTRDLIKPYNDAKDTTFLNAPDGRNWVADENQFAERVAKYKKFEDEVAADVMKDVDNEIQINNNIEAKEIAENEKRFVSELFETSNIKHIFSYDNEKNSMKHEIIAKYNTGDLRWFTNDISTTLSFTERDSVLNASGHSRDGGFLMEKKILISDLIRHIDDAYPIVRGTEVKVDALNFDVTIKHFGETEFTPLTNNIDSIVNTRLEKKNAEHKLFEAKKRAKEQEQAQAQKTQEQAKSQKTQQQARDTIGDDDSGSPYNMYVILGYFIVMMIGVYGRYDIDNVYSEENYAKYEACFAKANAMKATTTTTTTPTTAEPTTATPAKKISPATVAAAFEMSKTKAESIWGKNNLLGILIQLNKQLWQYVEPKEKQETTNSIGFLVLSVRQRLQPQPQGDNNNNKDEITAAAYEETYKELFLGSTNIFHEKFLTWDTHKKDYVTDIGSKRYYVDNLFLKCILNAICHVITTTAAKLDNNNYYFRYLQECIFFLIQQPAQFRKRFAFEYVRECMLANGHRRSHNNGGKECYETCFMCLPKTLIVVAADMVKQKTFQKSNRAIHDNLYVLSSFTIQPDITVVVEELNDAMNDRNEKKHFDAIALMNKIRNAMKEEFMETTRKREEQIAKAAARAGISVK